jgi:hypothetical protein
MGRRKGIVLSGHFRSLEDYQTDGRGRPIPAVLVESHPRRILAGELGTDLIRCRVCGYSFDMWMTDTEIWEELPEEFHREVICVGCFKGIIRISRRHRKRQSKS